MMNRSLLAEFLGSDAAAAEYRRRAEARERLESRAARTSPNSGFDASRWAELIARGESQYRRPAASPEDCRAPNREDVLRMIREELAAFQTRLDERLAGQLPDAIKAVLETMEI